MAREPSRLSLLLALVLAGSGCPAERLPPGPPAQRATDAGTVAPTEDELNRPGTLTVSPDPVVISASGSEQRVALRAVSSSLGDLTERVQWTLSDPALGDIGAASLRVPANPARGGLTTLTARFGAQSGSATVRVKLSAPAVVDPTAPTDAATRFGGAGRGLRIKVVYPFEQAMLPRNLSQLLLAWEGSADAEVYRVTIDGDTYAQALYLGPALCPQARCQYALPPADQVRFLTSVAGGETQISVQAAGKDGLLGGSEPVHLSVSPEDLRGALYYWSTSSQGLYRVSVDGRVPQVFATNVGCVGCHAVSPDGGRVATVIGGADGNVGVFRGDTAAPVFSPSGALKASFTAFSPQGDLLLRLYQGKLTIHRSDSGAALGEMPETVQVNHPEWSPDGKSVVYVRYPADGRQNGDVFSNNIGDVAVRPVTRSGDSLTFGEARTVAPSLTGKAYNFYPSFTPDSRWLVYNQGQVPCGGSGEGGLNLCGVYDARNTSLWLVNTDGTQAPLALARATHQAMQSTNWPRVAPFQQAGGKIIFVAFSARFDYAYTTSNRPQLWMAAVDLSRAQGGQDPSFAPFWLPAQRANESNHLATWTRNVACSNDQGCPEGFLCLGGVCLSKARQ